MEALLSPVGSIVQSHSVEVGDTDDDLEEVSGRVVCADAEDGDEAQWSPGENGDGFDADGEDVGGEVARVGESVFFPELGKERVFAGDACAVEDVVPFKGDMQEATQGKPRSGKPVDGPDMAPGAGAGAGEEVGRNYNGAD